MIAIVTYHKNTTRPHLPPMVRCALWTLDESRWDEAVAYAAKDKTGRSLAVIVPTPSDGSGYQLTAPARCARMIGRALWQPETMDKIWNGEAI